MSGNQNKMPVNLEKDPIAPLQEVAHSPNPETQQRFSAEVLHSSDIIDTEGYSRPMYEIGGRNVVFRGRQELVRIEGVDYTAVTGPGQEPLPIEHDANFSPDNAKNEAKLSEFQNYIAEASPTPESVLISANTPEGILMTAAQLNPEKADNYAKLAEKMANGIYDPEALRLLDAVTACLYVGDDGELGTKLPDGVRGLDIDAYALVTAALAGDEKANEVVESRISRFKRIFAEEKIGSLSIRSKEYEEWIERLGREPEELKAENVALVHSTAYAVERNEHGDAILKPSSQHRKDKFPRATLHFTPNSQVTSHYAGNWDAGNRLIVGNMQKMIDANGNPSVMSDVDTFFTVNPGEAVVMPDASVIEGSTEIQDLISIDGALVTYKAKPDSEYSEDERLEIEHLAGLHGLKHDPEYANYSDTLREIALRQTLQQKGVDPSMFATAGAHYSSNSMLSNSFTRLQKELGVIGGGLHTYTTESNIERLASESIRDMGGNVSVGAGYGYSNHLSLPALRQVTASGYWPARYAKPKEDPYKNAPFF